VTIHDETTVRPRQRASDLDRAATVSVLQEAVGRGLLTPDEGSERMAAAFATVYVADLAPLTEDLPPAPAVQPPGWRQLGALTVEQVRASLRTPGSGRLIPARVAVATFVAFVLVMLVGSMLAEFFFDGGDFGHHHFDRAGFND
jgi:hypothetical protein